MWYVHPLWQCVVIEFLCTAELPGVWIDGMPLDKSQIAGNCVSVIGVGLCIQHVNYLSMAQCYVVKTL